MSRVILVNIVSSACWVCCARGRSILRRKKVQCWRRHFSTFKFEAFHFQATIILVCSLIRHALRYVFNVCMKIVRRPNFDWLNKVLSMCWTYLAIENISNVDPLVVLRVVGGRIRRLDFGYLDWVGNIFKLVGWVKSGPSRFREAGKDRISRPDFAWLS